MRKTLKIVLAVIIAAFFVFFIRATDWNTVKGALQEVGFRAFFLVLVTFFSAWLGMLGWRACLPHEGKGLSMWRLFWIRMAGENIAILNPASMVGGEAAKIMMLRDMGIDQRTALKSIVISRAIMIGSQILMLIIAGIWFLGLNYPSGAIGIGVTLIILFSSIQWLRSKLNLWQSRPFFAERLPPRFLFKKGLPVPLQKARDYLKGLWQDILVFHQNHPGALVRSFVFCLLHWVAGSLEFYFILLFLGIKTTIAKALLVDMGVIVFKSAGAFIPGQIGIEEYGNKVMLATIGIAGSTVWITVSILRRTRQLFWIVLGAAVYLIKFRKPTALAVK